MRLAEAPQIPVGCGGATQFFLVSLLRDTWKANVVTFVKILLVLHFEYAGRVSVDKQTSKF